MKLIQITWTMLHHVIKHKTINVFFFFAVKTVLLLLYICSSINISPLSRQYSLLCEQNLHKISKMKSNTRNTVRNGHFKKMCTNILAFIELKTMNFLNETLIYNYSLSSHHHHRNTDKEA